MIWAWLPARDFLWRKKHVVISAVLLRVPSCFWLSRACHREDTRCQNAVLWGNLLCIQICLENSKLINMNIQVDIERYSYLRGGLKAPLDTEIAYDYTDAQS